MPVTALASTNLGLNQFFNYYDAPGSNKSLTTAIGSGALVTYPNRGSANINMAYYAGAGLYFFYLKVVNTNGTKGTVSITYPWSQSTAVTNGYVGGSKQVWTTTYPYITISVSVNYGYSFKGWYTQSVGGTLINSTANQNVYYTDTYRDSVWYAQYN